MQYLTSPGFATPASRQGVLRQLVSGTVSAHADEIGCADCFEEWVCFAEMELQGIQASHALPLVQDHLDRCPDCREEFLALLNALHKLS